MITGERNLDATGLAFSSAFNAGFNGMLTAYNLATIVFDRDAGIDRASTSLLQFAGVELGTDDYVGRRFSLDILR